MVRLHMDNIRSVKNNLLWFSAIFFGSKLDSLVKFIENFFDIYFQEKSDSRKMDIEGANPVTVGEIDFKNRKEFLLALKIKVHSHFDHLVVAHNMKDIYAITQHLYNHILMALTNNNSFRNWIPQMLEIVAKQFEDFEEILKAFGQLESTDLIQNQESSYLTIAKKFLCQHKDNIKHLLVLGGHIELLSVNSEGNIPTESPLTRLKNAINQSAFKCKPFSIF